MGTAETYVCRSGWRRYKPARTPALQPEIDFVTGPDRSGRSFESIRAASAPDRFGPCPGVGCENLLQGSVRHRLVLLHGAPDDGGYVRKTDPPVQKGFDGDLVCRV